MVETLECDLLCGQVFLYSYITMQRVDTGVFGNELRLGVLLNGKTNLSVGARIIAGW